MEPVMRRGWQAVAFLFLFLPLSLAQDQPSSGAASAPTESLNAAEQTSKRRPTLGLALEGGGALGLAHVGVLQWFEQHHIPIDYIAGTSMGGLVGGLYASGKSPKELQEIVEQQNWDIIIGGKTPYRDLSFRRKEDNRDYP